MEAFNTNSANLVTAFGSFNTAVPALAEGLNAFAALDIATFGEALKNHGIPTVVEHTIAPLTVNVNLQQAGFLSGLSDWISDAVKDTVAKAVPKGASDVKGDLE